MCIVAREYVICESDTGDGGWSIHWPGATEEDIACGDAPALVTGRGPITPRDWLIALGATVALAEDINL